MNPLISSDLDMPSPHHEPELDEKQDVATITTDEIQPMDEDNPSADDHEAMKKKFLPADPDLEIEEEYMSVWHIDDYNNQDTKTHSPTFKCAGTPWRLLMFPFGNNNANDWCSCYLEHAFDEKPPESWYTCVQFMIVAFNPKDPSVYIQNTASHRYNAEATDWGFNKFFELRKAALGWNETGRPLLEGRGITFNIYVRTVKDPTGVLWHTFENYDSKKETGMVGLKNQGATCYLNSLLQSLYLTNAFRKAIYQIPTEAEENARANSAYALQRLFYMLQHNDRAVSTDELTSAFGWDTRQTFVQQDVQELARLLMDNMEEKLKPTQHAKDLSNLFVGSTKTFLECINVDYASSSSQVFWDLQLNVRGQKTLDESFRNNLQVETMDGDNKYFAEGFGLQDARKGDIYEHFPPVLHLQLKRFEFNWEYNIPTKINDRLEFPEQFDASPYLSKDADRSEPWIYNLHGVLVHSGDLDAGHYYAFLKPEKDGPFYKFDDDRVTRATKKEAIDENFGGEFVNKPNGIGGGMQKNPFTFKYTKHRFMSAYMLVYIRQSRLDDVLRPIGENDVPAHLDRKIKEEQAEVERRRKEREEAHLYMSVLVGTTDNFKAFQGFDVFGSPTSESIDTAARPKAHRLLKSMKIAEFRSMMAKELGIEADLVRPWALVGRQNHTIRPDTPLDWDDLSLDETNHKINGKLPFRLWVETTSRKADGQPDWTSAESIMQHKNPVQPILIFLKYFDVENQSLKGHGCVYVEKSKRVSEFGPIILERMGWPTGTNMKLYEEIKSDMIEPLKTSNTFQQSELQTGDIICFQRLLPEAEANQISQNGHFTDAKQFYDYLLNRVTITFYDRTDVENEGKIFKLELSKKMNYDQVATRVGERLKVPPTHLRFSAVLQATGRPKPPVKRSANTTLASMTSAQMGIYGSTGGAVRQDILMYETLEISLSELENKKQVKLTFLSEGITKEEVFDVLVPKTGFVRDFIEPLKQKAKLSDEDERRLRFYEVHGNKFFKELDDNHPVSTFNEFVTIYADLVTKDEDEADPSTDRAIYCFNFEKEPTKVHSVPFKFVVKPGEPFKETKERLSRRTGIKGKNFERIKFAVVRRVNLSKPEYLNDDDILADKLIASDDQLGLDHLNKSRNVFKGDVMMIR